MEWLARVCVQRPVFATVLTLIILVVGSFSYRLLGVDNFPDVDVPVVIVTTRLPGASPTDVETEITEKIEGAVNTIGGIDELRSISSEGVSQVIVAFTIDKDTDVGAQEVRDKINIVLNELPDDVEIPVVSRVDPTASAVVLLALKADLPIREITELADKQVRRQLENIDGVGLVEIVGGRERQFNVWLDPTRLRANGITASEVNLAIGQQNLNVPGGSLESGPAHQTVRVLGRVETAEDLGSIVLRSTNGRPLRVRDVARVEDGMADEISAAMLNDTPIVMISVTKQSGRNTVAVVDAILKRLADVQQKLPKGATIQMVRDNSGTIRTGIAAVTEHLVVGSLLAALVVLLFLGNLRTTIIAAVAIPVSIIGTFAIMKLAGFTLNFLTLLALALAVGIVIDDAIVVLENIVRYIDEKGEKPFMAAVRGTKEIGLAVLATSISLIAVFVPIAYVGGVPGRFLTSFGLTMAFSIAVSLFVSFTLTPMMSARLLRAAGDKPNPLARVVDWFYRPIERAYLRVLGFCLRQSWLVVIACVVAIASCIPLAKRVPSAFLPADDQAQFQIRIKAVEGTSTEETRLIAERVATHVRRYEGVKNTVITVAEGTTAASNEAKIYAFLTDPDKRSFNQQYLMQRVRKEVLTRLPAGVDGIAGDVPEFSSGQSQAKVQYALTGPSIERLTEAVNAIVAGLRKHPGAVDVDTTLGERRPEVGVTIDRERAAALGIQVSSIAQTLRIFVGGVVASSISDGGEQYDVNVRADSAFRAEPAGLSLLAVPSPGAGAVPLSQVVNFEQGTGPQRIDHYNRQRQFTIMSNAAPGVGTNVVEAELKRLFAAQGLPSDYRLQPVGQSKTAGQLQTGFLTVMLLGFIFMYLVLAAQFESWSQPAIILLSLPLTVPFALISLLLLGQSLNMFSALGLLVLFGVVKKNAILQIDHTNNLRKEGRARFDAIMEANRDRLRPILMTTFAFVAGMAPLIFSKGVGAGRNQAASGIVVGGQLMSLLLTLVAVPVAYDLFDRSAIWIRARRNRAPIDRGERELEAYVSGQRLDVTAEDR